MINHPDDVKSEWVAKTATTSKSLALDQPSEKSPIVLNSDSVYGALNKPRKRPRNFTSKPGPSKAGKYISKYLYQPIAVPKQKKKQIRLGGARVLTSEECIKIMQEKENVKKQKELEIQKRKDERERKKREKAAKEKLIKEKQKGREATKSKTNSVTKDDIATNTKNTQKGKGKAPVQAPIEDNDTHNSETCPICKQSFEDVEFKMGDWLKCDCGQWLHEDCLFYDFTEPYLCPECAEVTF